MRLLLPVVAAAALPTGCTSPAGRSVPVVPPAETTGAVPATASAPAPQATVTLEREEWTTPGASTFVEVRVPGSECLKDHGCPFEPQRLKPCPADVVSRAGRVIPEPSGQTVLLRGRLVLSDLTETLLQCEPVGCCNTTSGSLLVEVSSPIGLWSSDHPAAFQCQGDGSGLCCGLEVPEHQDVVVYGSLVAATSVPEAGISASHFVVLDPLLCICPSMELP